MYKKVNPFIDYLPSIDLHGYNRDMVKCILDEFINDNIKMNNKKINVIHGNGKGILKEEVSSLLAKDKRVYKYYLDAYNIGCTIIELQ